MIYRTYTSPDYWSGEGKSFSGWYILTAGPSLEGYRIAYVQFRLGGDRRCGAFAECEQLSQNTWRFRMQGHDERARWVLDSIDSDGIHFRREEAKATSVGILTIAYVPN